MRIAGFILITCFYFAYFYKQVSLRKQGVHSNRLGKGDKPDYTVRIEKALLVSTYTTAVLQYVSIFFSTLMIPLVFPSPIRMIGIILTACGVVIFFLAITTMRGNWRAGVDGAQETKIVQKGIYKLSRNPAFVGFDLLYIGSALSFSNGIITVAVLCSIILLHLQILEEEKYLLYVFGKTYKQYKERTPRYFSFFK